MYILSLDPGPKQSAYLFYDAESKNFLDFGKVSNETFLDLLDTFAADIFVYEKMQNYGVGGASTFETCVWTGRFIQRWIDRTGKSVTGLYRYQVKSNICPKKRSNDSIIRQALIDRFGKQGSKKNPGPTYGIKADIWSALAIAVTYADLNYEEEFYVSKSGR